LSWFFHSLSLFLTHPTSPLFPYTTLFRSKRYSSRKNLVPPEHVLVFDEAQRAFDADKMGQTHANTPGFTGGRSEPEHLVEFAERDRKSTRLNSSHEWISYAVFCLKKKKNK